MAGADTPDYALLLDFHTSRHVVAAFVDRALAPSGVNGGEFAIYSLLAGLGPQTPQRLGEIMGFPPTTVSSLARRLEDRGHVTRRPHPTDGRSHVLALTDEGRATHRDAADRFFAVYAELEERLPVPVREIRVALRLLENAVRDAAGLGPGTYRVETRGAGPPDAWLSEYFSIEPDPAAFTLEEERAVADALTNEETGRAGAD